jgi:ATP-binding cassette subfamily F protein 3
VHQGKASPFDGDLEDYAKWLSETDVAPRPQARDEARNAEARRQRKREEAEARNRLSPLKAAVARWERELDRLARERAEIHAALSSSELYGQGKRTELQDLLTAQTRLARETEAAEAAWLESNERLESESGGAP